MGRPKKIKIDIKEDSENIFKGKCIFCGYKIRKERNELNISINMFNDEYSFLNCPDCKGNKSIRLTIKENDE